MSNEIFPAHQGGDKARASQVWGVVYVRSTGRPVFVIPSEPEPQAELEAVVAITSPPVAPPVSSPQKLPWLWLVLIGVAILVMLAFLVGLTVGGKVL